MVIRWWWLPYTVCSWQYAETQLRISMPFEKVIENRICDSDKSVFGRAPEHDVFLVAICDKAPNRLVIFFHFFCFRFLFQLSLLFTSISWYCTQYFLEMKTQSILIHFEKFSTFFIIFSLFVLYFFPLVFLLFL